MIQKTIVPNNPLLKELETKIGIEFHEISKLEQALIHRSYLNENKSLPLESNERYEFLGDAILELWTSHTLFSLFPNLKEGDLTNLRALIVRTENLAENSKAFDLGKFIYLSRGEEIHGGRSNQSILADTFEAITGAVFLDQGFDKAAEFLKRFLEGSIEKLSSHKVYKDPKSLFQEIAQAQKGITPHYVTIQETGPDHQKVFEVAVYLADELIATGKGNSKLRAEEDASTKATKLFKNLV